MNILTFDVEDWYNCDFKSKSQDWDRYEVRIYDGLEKILLELETRQIKATFFCLGWVAQKHPEIVKKINSQGHHIGCHSYQHDLILTMNRKSFRKDTEMAKKYIEDLIGESIDAYRAPGFSITKNTLWALEILSELGFKFDCSFFPGSHDYGGFTNYKKAKPALIKLENGAFLKEFPINCKNIFGKKIVFSGGGFFRFFPYPLIKYWSKNSDYIMTYFHSRDFDSEQPMLDSLSLNRKFKSYVGLSRSFAKFKLFLDDFSFLNIIDADKNVDWDNVDVLEFWGGKIK